MDFRYTHIIVMITAGVGEKLGGIIKSSIFSGFEAK